MKAAVTLILALIIAAPGVLAEVPEYICRRTTEKIVIDGILSEADWQAAETVGDFVFPWYESGEKEQTGARLMWDDTYLYLSFRCDDAHIWAEYYDINDPTYNDDCVELFWNPSPDRQQNYYQFEINCIGNLLSVLHGERSTIMLPHIGQTIDGTVNDDTDTDSGWIIEAAIRFDEYPGLFTATPPQDGDMWRIGLNRCGGNTNPQYSQWSPSQTSRPSFHQPDDFGRLVFSKDSVR